jgi:hypothetical protein
MLKIIDLIVMTFSLLIHYENYTVGANKQ